MDIYSATEEAYKRGYADGYENGKVNGVAKARWIQDGIYICCSACCNVTMMPHLKRLPRYRYCPHCGAKMYGDT